MAEKLESFPFRQRYNSLYPWQEWGDGSIWKITRGGDFAVSAENFRANLIGRAKRMGKKARTAVRGDSVIFQFYDPENGTD